MDALEALLEQFFAENLLFYTVTQDPWDYNGYLNSCIVGGELNPLQCIDGAYFVTNGLSTHICGTQADLTAFALFVQWVYAPEQLQGAYPNITVSLDDYAEDEREIIMFYHRNRSYYAVADYRAFREYLKSIVAHGRMLYRLRDDEFYFVNHEREYLVGLPGEITLFTRWCAKVHESNRIECFCDCPIGICLKRFSCTAHWNITLDAMVEDLETLEKTAAQDQQKRLPDLWQVDEDTYW